MPDESLEVRQVRLAQNQTLFREVNERVESILVKFAADGPVGFVCECAIEDCSNHIELTRDEYEAVRTNPTHFFVLRDHVFPEVEVIVDDRDTYVVVEKIGAGGRIARAKDARSAAHAHT
jgi:hypothetical protein